MKPREYISFLNSLEKLKWHTRHCETSPNRRESVADHSWRLAVMAMLCADEYPDLDIDRVIKMCLIHDFGEIYGGDIPAFEKTAGDEEKEEKAVDKLLSPLPEGIKTQLNALFDEMDELKTPEAKLYKALDNMEALIAHNEAPLSSWIELEYTENLSYGQKNVEWSEWTRELKEEIKKDSIEKMKRGD